MSDFSFAEYCREVVAEERVRVSLDKSLRLLRPSLDGVPLPGGAPADEPVGLGEQAAPLPLVDGGSADIESVGDVGEANEGGVGGGHDSDCSDSIDGGQREKRMADRLLAKHFPWLYGEEPTDGA